MIPALVLAASTGHPWCDTDLLAHRYAAAHAYTIECRDENNEHAGWADHDNRRIVIWTRATGSPEYTRKTLLHELGHVVNGSDETKAEHFSYCVRPEPVRYFAPTPTAEQCDQVVGDPVVHAYAAFLGRMPDQDGWTYWTARLDDIGQAGVHDAISQSAEANT